MKKFLLFYIVPFLTICIAVIKLPEVDKWLKEQGQYSPLYVGIFIAACTLVIHFINVISPFKKYEQIEKNKWQILNLVTKNFNDDFFRKNKLSANIMVLNRCIINKRQPASENDDTLKRRWFQRVFKIVWSYSSKPIDKRINLTIKQGCSGLAYKYGKPTIVDIRNDGSDHILLNDNQKSAVSHLEFIISCPIFAMNKRYNTDSPNIIGILNVACSHRASRFLVDNSDERIKLTEATLDFSKICSLIM